jgi:hypothetical protein
MNAKFVSALSTVAMLLGLCVLPASPVQAGGLAVTVTYTYVMFGSGGAGPHQRQPRTINATGGFTLLKPPQTSISGPGGTIVVQSPTNNPTTSCNPQTCRPAFVTISGGSLANNGLPASVTWTDFSVSAPTVWVEDAPISVLYVYIPIGSGSCRTPCPPPTDWGATIDSYDETKQSLFDDTFVKVTPDANGSLTTSGNVEGYVDTKNSAETITALSPTTQFDSIPPDSGDKFFKWLLLGPTETTASDAPAWTVTKQTSPIALAIYDSPVSVKLGCKAEPSDVQDQLFVTNTTSQPIKAGLTITYTFTQNTSPSGEPPHFVTTGPATFTLASPLQPNKSAAVPNPPRGTGGTCEATLSSI